MPASTASVLVTGATGFIGQRLVRTLLHKGLNVRVLVRPDKSPDSRMPDVCEQVPASLTDVDSLTTVVARSSAVIYCAGSVRGRSLADFKTANIEGVRAMLEALEQTGNTAPLLLLSSLAASRPELSDYARSKFEGEQLLQDRTSLNWTIIRPPAVYGPGDREMLPILKMARKGLLAHAGPVDQRLSLLHVDDLVNAIVTWLSAPEKCQHQIYAIDDGTAGGYSWSNIGEAVSDKQIRLIPVPRLLLKTVAHLNLQLAKIFDYAPMLSPGKVRELVQADWLCDNSSFTEATGWTPELNLEQGAEQLFGAPEDGSKT